MNATATQATVELPDGLGGGMPVRGRAGRHRHLTPAGAARSPNERGLVVVTGTAPPTGDASLEMMEQGRASWLRADLEITRA